MISTRQILILVVGASIFMAWVFCFELNLEVGLARVWCVCVCAGDRKEKREHRWRRLTGSSCCLVRFEVKVGIAAAKASLILVHQSFWIRIWSDSIWVAMRYANVGSMLCVFSLYWHVCLPIFQVLVDGWL
jgi:hypothetical protein